MATTLNRSQLYDLVSLPRGRHSPTRPALPPRALGQHENLELGPEERDPLYAGARATLMLGGWPEPFGLVAIESMATGTPVIARRAGALTETVEHGVTGFLVDDVNEAELALERLEDLDRSEIRARTLERFSAERMADEYEAVYRDLVRARPATPIVEPALRG